MLISCPLTQMTTIEKLQIMENIWDDLCRKADEVASPFWHEDILKEREKAVEDGSETFTDWERAKKQIRKSLYHEN